MNILAVIPARSGSKRVPNKNIRDFHGKPLISWAIEAARGSSMISKTFVSTDDEEIAEVARVCGAEVPFLRPPELAQDTTKIEPVLLHAYEEMRNIGFSADVIVLLMATNPLRASEHLDEAISMYSATGATSVVSVHTTLGNRNPHWIIKKDESGVRFFNNTSLKHIIGRSQDLPPCYSRNDVIYVINPKNLYEKPSNLYGDHIELFVMDDIFDADINSEEDWHIAYDKFRRHRLN
jgi:CMP-N-acetylneuraminic acid synthetase